MAVTLTGYGGVGEIGGNAFLLDDGRSRIFLDFGKRFGNDPRLDPRRGIDTRHMVAGWNDYFDDFLQPRAFRMALDLARLGIIPDIPTLWRQDRGGAAGPAPVDGVLVSHAHMDHCGLLGLLRPDVPVLASPETQATLASLQATGTGVLSEMVAMRPKGILPRSDGSPGKGTEWKEDGRPVEARRRFDEADGDIGAWRLRHMSVDHSIHGARGTLLEGPEVTIAYTGDFRMHGRGAAATAKFVERASGVDVLITEGTRVSRSHGHAHDGTDDEASVEGEIQSILDRTGATFVGISFPPRDLDRFLSVWNVARRSGRRLVIPTKLAHLITSLRAAGCDLPDPLRDRHLAIHVPAKGRGVLHMPPGKLRMPQRDLSMEEVDVGHDRWRDFWHGDHQTWELPLLENTVTSGQVAAEPASYLFSISYWSINELFDLFPHASDGPNGVYIHSMTQPFNDEMEIGDRKLARWLDAFRLERHDTHVSGHLSEEDLHWVIDEVGATRLVPVHSQAPDLTAARYEARTGHKALVPQAGKALPLA